jgi:cysteine desulfurase / selenocysteine lyase
MAFRVAEVRKQIPALQGKTYLDNAGAGLPPRMVTHAMQDFLADWSGKGENWEEWLMEVVETRRLFGRLVGGKASEVGIVPSVSAALAAVGSSLNERDGAPSSRRGRRKVVTSALNFPTNVINWQRMRESGLLDEVVVLGRDGAGMVPIEAYREAIDDETALVALDYVSWLSGARENIREIGEIAHAHGSLLLVDSFHALGVFPFDVRREGIDVLVSGFYKWLCGPHGVACVYVREDVLPHLVPSFMGWHGIKDNVADRVVEGRDPFGVPFPLDRAEPAPSATRFEWGTWAAVCVAGANEAMRFTQKTGGAERYKRIRGLREQVQAGLEEIGLKSLTPTADENEGSGIVTFRAEEEEEDTVSRLMKKDKIVTSSRFGCVRISPHFYNTPTEVDSLILALRRMKKRG